MEEHLVSLRAPNSLEAEHYRLVRHQLEQLHESSGLRVVGITSAAVGDGKTTTAINLAATLAQGRQSRILAVDCDLRRPSLAKQLGLVAQEPGLVDLVLPSRIPSQSLGEGRVAGDPDLELVLNPGHRLQGIVRRRFRNLAVLPVGRNTERPYELLKSPRMGEVLAEARQLYDFVILDLPPVLLVPDCRQLAPWIDGFIVVIAAHRTRRELLEEALDALEPTKVIGLVLNRDDQPLSGYHASYYRANGLSRSGNRPWWRLANSQ